MLRSNYQTVVFSIEQEYAQKERTSVSPSFVERLSAFATGITKGLETYWNVPANDRQVRAESALFPTWYK